MLSEQSNIKFSQQEALMMWPCVEVKNEAWWDRRPGQAFSHLGLAESDPYLLLSKVLEAMDLMWGLAQRLTHPQ